MTIKTKTHLRTAAALKADAQLLSGERSRVARAAIGDASSTPASPAGSVGEIWLYGVVGGWWRGFDAESVSRALRDLDVDTLFVRIHSPGGIASDGIAIANLFRNHRAKVVSVVDGLATSAASVIAIAGDEVVMCPGSQMMLHDASLWTGGNAAQLRRDADWLDGQSNNYAGVYAYKAGGTADTWRQVMLANEGEGTWYTADDAVTAGLADEVGTRVATSSPPVAPEDDFDETDDEMLARVEHDLLILERDVPASARAAWQSTSRGPAPKAAHKPPTASAGGSTTTQETEAAMTFTSEQLTTMRDKLQLPADADETAIVNAVNAVVAENLEENPPTAKVPEGMKLVSATVFDDVTAKAERGSKAAEELLQLKTDAFLDKHKDKFPPTDEARTKWAADYKRDAAGTEAYLAAASPLVPTGEVGHGDAPENTTGAATLAQIRESDDYKSWEI